MVCLREIISAFCEKLAMSHDQKCYSPDQECYTEKTISTIKMTPMNFVFRKLEFDMIYYIYLSESPSKYYISILGVVGGPELGKT